MSITDSADSADGEFDGDDATSAGMTTVEPIGGFMVNERMVCY